MKEIVTVISLLQRGLSLPEIWWHVFLSFKTKFNVPEYNKGTKTKDADICQTHPS